MVSSREIYGVHYGFIYLCRLCDAYVGVHKKSKSPLGTLANKEDRYWRKKAHIAFDPLWNTGDKMKRSDAYKWLASQMGLTIDECHIAMFDKDMCQKAIKVISIAST